MKDIIVRHIRNLGRLRWRWAFCSRAALVSALILALPVVSCSNPPGGAIEKEDAVIVEARAAPLDTAGPARDAVGGLRYRGGLALHSTDERFGGLSGLLVSRDGGSMIVVSDNGYWIGANLVHDRNGDLVDVADVTITPMRALDGHRLRWGRESDAEALARAPDGGIFVAFERDHRIWRYDLPGDIPEPVETPAAFADQPLGEGVEALTTLADGRLLAFSEGLKTQGGMVAWLRNLDGGWDRLTWKTGGGFRPTGATTLPDGGVLVLERRWLPVGARFRRIAPETIKPGAVLDGPEIARLEGSLTVDNMEGIDARRGADGKTYLYVVSDDNYSPLQTTLLMMFELAVD